MHFSIDFNRARLLGTERTFVDDLDLFDHRLEVPLAWTDAEDERQLEVFVREVRPRKPWNSGGADLVDGMAPPSDLPGLVFLQGGPGSPSPRPVAKEGWLGAALDRGFRVFLLDQRGTGRSSAVDRNTARKFDGDDAALAEYLTHFRADDIVFDAEAARALLNGAQPWTTLGQSFGGFITLAYLSRFPEALTASLFTGGLAAIHENADSLYRETLRLTEARNRVFQKRYPRAVLQAERIVQHLQQTEEKLPTGERFTPRRFQQLGLMLGSWHGITNLAYLLDDAFTVDGKHLSDRFLAAAGGFLSFQANPLYAVLHESIYAQGYATNWSAHRMKQELPQFDVDASPFMFTGESIHPWQFDEDPALRPFKGAAEILAQKSDFGDLYDLAALAECPVPVAAQVYLDDIFVPFDFSMRTASLLNAEVNVTNRLHHDGIRGGGPGVFTGLLDMLPPRGARYSTSAPNLGVV